MRGTLTLITGMLILIAAHGCSGTRVTRMATRIEDVPRVDLELSGNRGYLIGTPPPASEQKTTRKMLHTDVELPSFYTPTPGSAPAAGIDPYRSPADGVDAAAPMVEPAVDGSAAPVDTYVVQRGESLWKIAARPEVYGNGNAWRRIFDANQDLLKKGPDSLREGMTLRIPRGDAGAGQGRSDHDDEGMTFRK